MKVFLVKTSIIFIFIFLLFRFTIISLVNDYETKILHHLSNSNINEIKIKILDEIKSSNSKEKILYEKDAKIIGSFLKKILIELNLR